MLRKAVENFRVKVKQIKLKKQKVFLAVARRTLFLQKVLHCHRSVKFGNSTERSCFFVLGREDLQERIPMGQTLINIRTNGFATEQDELAFANKLELDKIKTALGE